MATRPKAIIESRNGEKFSPITIAKNVLTDNGQNLHDILSDRKEDMMTPTIENSSSMFKVGQGDNVDYSSDIVNGAYESMVLKGKTMVNCIQESSSQDVVLPYEFADGQYVTINDTKESGTLGVELKGQTLVNLISDITQIRPASDVQLIEYSLSPMSFIAKYGTITANTGNNRIVVSAPFRDRLKLNEDYTIIYDYELLENPDGVDCQISIAVDSWGQMADSPIVRTPGSMGKVIHCRNRASNAISETLNFINNKGTNAKWKISNLMLLEGNWTNKDIPTYFEGMASCKMPILHTVGKNLLNDSTSVSGWISDTGVISVRGELGVGDNYLSDYIYTGDMQHIKSNTGVWVWKFDENKNFISLYSNGTVDIDVSDCAYIRIGRSCGANAAVNLIGTMQLEFGTQSTSYEPHKSSILSLPEEVVLRSLPNGVCDTFNTRTGVYTQRIGEVFLNGSENWAYNPAATDKTLGLSGFSLPVATTPNRKLYGSTLCDKMPVITSLDKVGVYNGQGLNILIKSDSTNVNTLKEILAKDPITVQYELETPIVTKINLPSTLKSWNTTTHIYSEIPENTLYPTLSHSNPTYPVILKPSTKYSIVANSYSNSHTNSAINFNLGGATASTTVGNRVTTVTTPSTLSNELLTMSGRGNKLNNVMVIEGDVAGDEPYFEGMCDCKSPILSNVGKNLFDERKVILNKYQNHNTSNENFSISTNTNYKITDFIRVKPNTKYDNQIGNGAYYNIDKKPLTNHSCGISIITTPSDAHYVVLNMRINEDTSTGYFIEAPQRVTHEPYKSNITTFDQKDDKTIILRSLPNGVCDTLNVETGEYVQRIGETVLDGSDDENWGINNTEGTTTNRFISQSLQNSNVDQSTGVGQFLCDKLKTEVWNQTSRLGLTINGQDVFIYNASIDYSASAIKQWLSQNPITVQYELAIPITKTVDLSGYPFSYENGHVVLSSGSIEQSLTPKVEYSVVTNRNGQIRSNQKMVERHQKQLDRLQAMILTNLVNTQYEQALTNLKYDLKNVREEVK